MFVENSIEDLTAAQIFRDDVYILGVLEQLVYAHDRDVLSQLEHF